MAQRAPDFPDTARMLLHRNRVDDTVNRRRSLADELANALAGVNQFFHGDDAIEALVNNAPFHKPVNLVRHRFSEEIVISFL
jgi:hypothetical protein